MPNQACFSTKEREGKTERERKRETERERKRERECLGGLAEQH